MRLPREGVEYARLEFDDLPPEGILVEASLDRATWTACPLLGDDYLYLVRGPDSTATQGALVVAGGPIWARVHGDPEVFIRKVGLVTLY